MSPQSPHMTSKSFYFPIFLNLKCVILLFMYSLKRQAVAVREISEVGDDWKSFDVIGIDEGQFFTDVS